VPRTFTRHDLEPDPEGTCFLAPSAGLGRPPGRSPRRLEDLFASAQVVMKLSVDGDQSCGFYGAQAASGEVVSLLSVFSLALPPSPGHSGFR